MIALFTVRIDFSSLVTESCFSSDLEKGIPEMPGVISVIPISSELSINVKSTIPVSISIVNGS